MNKEFITLVTEFRSYIERIKSSFDTFDKECLEIKKRHLFLNIRKVEIFYSLDLYFEKIWKYVEALDKKEFTTYRSFYLSSLQDLLLFPIEINKYIYDKPLGQPGDHVMLNYIYDYYGHKQFLGNSTYQKLINNYTCNIPIAHSNNLRKLYFKNKLDSLFNQTEPVSILSFGCGAARELIELYVESTPESEVTIDLIDSNQDALDYIKEHIDQNEEEKIRINYQFVDYIDILRRGGNNLRNEEYDLIYCPGIFDYLTKRMAQNLINYLYSLLNPEGELIICNANKKSIYHRAYYEMIGGWTFIHRDREEILALISNIQNAKRVFITEEIENNCYSYLHILKA